jgi:ribonuclease P protein component
MFKRENRLVTGVKFNNSCLFIVPQFILKEKKNNLDLNRFGIVVSKKIDKRAVGRNKIKRFFRNQLSKLEAKMSQGHDILLIIRSGVAGKTNDENVLTLKQVLTKANLFK